MTRLHLSTILTIATLTVTAPACKKVVSQGDPDAGTDGGQPVDVSTDPHCENITPGHCFLPWPSDRWLVDDATRPTGFRLQYDPAGAPPLPNGEEIDVVPFTRLDGFSGSSQIMTMFDEPADLTGVAAFDDIPPSLDPAHPTVIIDLQTGEWIAHWAENDARAQSADETVLYLRPATRLAPDRTYVVAMRNLDGQSGQALAPSPMFAALRDNIPTTSTEVEARRAHFETLFAALESAGVGRADLQVAWSFHTASDEAIRRTMLFMHADALAQLGPNGIGCTITEVDPDFDGNGTKRLRGTVTTPWYLDAPLAPAAIVRDADDNPVYQGNEEVLFTMIVPTSLDATDQPGPLITFGHGLFGDADGTVSSGGVRAIADEAGAVVVGTDWHGMSNKDLNFLGTALTDPGLFYMVGENLQQGMINFIALTRTFIGVCADLPELQSQLGTPVIDPSRRYYVGGSQGSILGGGFLPLSPDIDRGALIVGGANFSFMIERSIHYNTFGVLLELGFPDRLDNALLMAMGQHIWDNAETAAWLRSAEQGLPGIGPKRYVYLIAENDAQVPNLSSDLAVRDTGIPVLTGSVRLPWGVPRVDPPVTTSAFISFDVGDPPVPDGNLSPPDDFGGHGSVAFQDDARQMLRHFLETGEIDVSCNPCSFPP